MAFTLNIHFMGLCMFVPDQPDPGLTSVLLPSATGDVPPHVAMLAVDLAYLQPGSAALTGQYTLLSLQSAEISLQRLGIPLGPPPPPGQSPPIPDLIANVGEVVRKPIIPAVLGPDPQEYLNARVVLGLGTCTPVQVECWRYPAPLGDRQLAQGAQWTIPNVNGTELALRPAAFGIAPAPLIPVLYPVASTTPNQPPVPTIDLMICNTAVYELPIMPQSLQLAKAGFPGSHFKAFYDLFEMDILDVRWDMVPCPRAPGSGELPYTCMGPAQSVATPR